MIQRRFAHLEQRFTQRVYVVKSPGAFTRPFNCARIVIKTDFNSLNHILSPPYANTHTHTHKMQPTIRAMSLAKPFIYSNEANL